MAVDTFTPSEILKRIRFDPLIKKGSVYDVIRLVTGCEPKHAVTNFQRMEAQFSDVTTRCGMFKFPGQGQRPTPVAFLKDLIEIAWLCPGRNAKEFRRTGAVTMCRALGGDLSLVEEIKARRGDVSETEQAALLAGTGVTAAEANGQAVTRKEEDPEERQNRLKRRRAETAMLEIRVEQERVETAKMALGVYNQLASFASTHDDERDRLFFKDAARNFARTNFGSRMQLDLLTDGGELADTQNNTQITISDTARGMGVRLTRGDESRVGRAAAALYREKYGENPPKHERFVDGAVRNVNLYFAKDRDVLERAVTDTLGSRLH